MCNIKSNQNISQLFISVHSISSLPFELLFLKSTSPLPISYTLLRTEEGEETETTKTRERGGEWEGTNRT